MREPVIRDEGDRVLRRESISCMQEPQQLPSRQTRAFVHSFVAVRVGLREPSNVSLLLQPMPGSVYGIGVDYNMLDCGVTLVTHTATCPFQAAKVVLRDRDDRNERSRTAPI